ncbi:oxidoreductase, putative [Talaromyces stipitatus ATCC 10500]|uniref:Oxidoreductase, putative n=1 Tax=Talaromyces stipitatus (strain ATCC 10500 / CBS 375.48 / QM 6759 / NRRL 1006) TaxID=441959 RepID=B8MMN8_TALSN|nr:oxidoreductase, putative [Talaromyces stipitatus ATCC 10500]EED13605.1 oxidoreductase, putative [Talaromyces stipitatus ATCC 10500]
MAAATYARISGSSANRGSGHGVPFLPLFGPMLQPRRLSRRKRSIFTEILSSSTFYLRGCVFIGARGFSRSPNSSPEYCRRAIEKSLKRLGLPYIDLYYIHPLDKVTPIEKIIQAMVEPKKNEGKIKHLGISECSAESLRRAHAVHPITAIQIEYSLLCREVESPQIRLLETARELKVAVVCYCPLGNAFLTGRYHTIEDVSGPGDSRSILPWFYPDNLKTNLVILDKITETANAKGITPSRLALAWLLAQGDDIFPIPGTTSPKSLDENLASISVDIAMEEEKLLRDLASYVVGERFQAKTGYSYGDTPLLKKD